MTACLTDRVVYLLSSSASSTWDVPSLDDSSSECWLMADRNLRISLVLSVFPAPLSPLGTEKKPQEVRLHKPSLLKCLWARQWTPAAVCPTSDLWPPGRDRYSFSTGISNVSHYIHIDSRHSSSSGTSTEIVVVLMAVLQYLIQVQWRSYCIFTHHCYSLFVQKYQAKESGENKRQDK